MQHILEIDIFWIFKDTEMDSQLNKNEIITQIPIEIKQQHSSNKSYWREQTPL